MDEISRRAVLAGAGATVAATALPAAKGSDVAAYFGAVRADMQSALADRPPFVFLASGSWPQQAEIGQFLTGTGIGDCVILGLRRISDSTTEVTCRPVAVDHGAGD
jgi:hypothetical protein